MKPIYTTTLLLCAALASGCGHHHPPPRSERAERYVYVCHKGRTLHLPASSARAHLRHGDYRGKCRHALPPPPPPKPRHRLEEPTRTICHEGRTLTLPVSQARRHLRHGAYTGRCRTHPPRHRPEAPRAFPPPRQPAPSPARPARPVRPAPPAAQPAPRPSRPARPAPETGGETRVTICHQGRQTIQVPQSALQGHLNHGDYLGACRR